MLINRSNVVFMVIALVTVFRTKRRSVRRRKSMKHLDSGDRANLDLFKYVSILFNMLKFSEHLPQPLARIDDNN